MKLKKFYEEYLRRRTSGDMLHAYYTDGGKYPHKTISEDKIADAYKNGGLIMEADIIRTSEETGEGSNISFTGRGSEFHFTWYCAEIDADQAKIALGIHEALRQREPSKAAGAKPKTKTKGRKKRFAL